MKYISLFSGIEAATVAWKPLGWSAVRFAEFEAFPSAVLAHHYPDVVNVGDVTKYDWSQHKGEIDVLVGGFPCQAFSVAGLRQSLDDDRGNLSLEYCRILDAIEPRYAVAENVPGWLSTKDNAFGCFLAAVTGGDSPLVLPKNRRWTDAGMVVGPKRAAAWRVLDAQYFGVAQRRRRVFVIICPRDGADPSEILFIADSLLGNPPPRRQTGQGVAGTVKGGSGERGYPDPSDGNGGGLTVASPLQSRSYKGENADSCAANLQVVDFGRTADRIQMQSEVAVTLQGEGGGGGAKTGLYCLPAQPVTCQNTGHGWWNESPVAQTLRTPDGGGSMEANVVVEPADTYRWQNADAGIVPDDIAASLKGKGTTTDERSVGAYVMAFTAGAASGAHSIALGEEVTPPIRGGANGTTQVPSICMAHGQANAEVVNDGEPSLSCNHEAPIVVHGTQDPCVSDIAFAQGQNGGGENVLCEPVLGDGRPGRGTLRSGRCTELYSASAVRRLTPIECERLQGFKDSYTAIPWRGKPADRCPDAPRYKALGNSMAVPVMRWIGERIHAAHAAVPDAVTADNAE